MKICTWNSQGNPLNDAIKLNILNHLLTIEQCNVVMIQECGKFILPAQHGGVSKFTPSFKISQSPNFHKLGLCYSIIFLYLYGKKFLICQRYNLFPI